MKVGFIGLGKLGFPCAFAMSLKGHDVMGYDVDPDAMSNHPKRYHETTEDGVSAMNDILDRSNLKFGSLADVVNHSEIVFVAVQTPHDPRFEGCTRLPAERRDFEYRFLREAVSNISAETRTTKIVVIISTVLPGTLRREILPVASPLLKICYNPYFIAMGTTIRDFLHPEFILLGVHDQEAAQFVEQFYSTITAAPVYRTSVENAELIKVAYNTFIGMKIAFANTVMELCHHLPGTDADQVMGGIKMSNRRLISPAYLDGGMGDGGGCHPRDNIALSWLARSLSLSHDWFEGVMLQTRASDRMACGFDGSIQSTQSNSCTAFKAETNIVTGSPALLLKEILQERGHDVFCYDPMVEGKARDISNIAPHVFLVGAKHEAFRVLSLPSGSVVLDPWRFVEDAGEDVEIIPIGIGPRID